MGCSRPLRTLPAVRVQAAHRQSLAGLILAHIECIYEFFEVAGEALFVMPETRNDKHPPSYRVFV
jgi:hypothetical protein